MEPAADRTEPPPEAAATEPPPYPPPSPFPAPDALAVELAARELRAEAALLRRLACAAAKGLTKAGAVPLAAPIVPLAAPIEEAAEVLRLAAADAPSGGSCTCAIHPQIG